MVYLLRKLGFQNFIELFALLARNKWGVSKQNVTRMKANSCFCQLNSSYRLILCSGSICIKGRKQLYGKQNLSKIVGCFRSCSIQNVTFSLLKVKPTPLCISGHTHTCKEDPQEWLLWECHSSMSQNGSLATRSRCSKWTKKEFEIAMFPSQKPSI